MRIVIDLQGMQSPASANRGVGRYTEGLVRQILAQNKVSGRHEIFLALNGQFRDTAIKIRNDFQDIIEDDHIIVWQQFYDTTAYNDPKEPIVRAAKISREIFLNHVNPDIIFSTNLQEGLGDSSITSVKIIQSDAKYISTLHDVVPYYYHYLNEDLTRDWYFGKIADAKNSDLVITVSETSRKQIIEKTGIDEDKIINIYNGYDEKTFNDKNIPEDKSRKILDKYEIENGYFLYFGGSDAHKNLHRLIHAYKIYYLDTENPLKLVLGGGDIRKSEGIKSLIEELELTSQIIMPGYIWEADLPTIIKAAHAFVFPSMHEGFGLPALEAMACGVATIGAKDSSVAEIIAQKEALFDGTDRHEIAALLSKLTSDPDFRTRIAANGLVRARDFSWAKAATAFLQVIETIVPRTKQTRSYFNPVSSFIEYMGDQLTHIGERTREAIAHSIGESFFEDRKKRLFIDISSVFVHDYKSGIQRVTRAICQELLNGISDDYEAILIYSTPSEPLFFEANSYLKNAFGIDRKRDNYTAEMQQGDILLYLDLHPGVAIAHHKHAQYLRGKGVRVFHIVYDLLPLLRPKTFWPELCQEFQAWIQVVSMSDGAICISRAVADELKGYLTTFGARRPDPLKLGWFHLGADINNSVPSRGLPDDAQSVLQRVHRARSFIMVGTIEPRKGHMQTLEAFDRLWKEECDDIILVIVGRLGWGMPDFAEKIRSHPELGSRVYWLNGISDEYLTELYQASSCLIAASDGEGFGLPLIEAAQRSMPMIIRNIPVFKEVAGAHAEYFEDSKDPSVIANAVRSWIAKFATGMHVQSENMPWLTWGQSAQQLMNIISKGEWYDSVVGGGAIIPGVLIGCDNPDVDFLNFTKSKNSSRELEGDAGEIAFFWHSEVSYVYAQCHLTSLAGADVEISINGHKVYDGRVIGKDVMLSFGAPHIKEGRNILRFTTGKKDKLGEQVGPDQRLTLHNFKISTLGKPIEANKPIPYSSDDIEWQSFGAPEKGYRWSVGYSSSMAFFWDGDKAQMQLQLAVVGSGMQKVTVSMNGLNCTSVDVEGGHPNKSKAQYISCAVKLNPGYNIIQLDVPNAQNPEHNDDRVIGIAIREMILMDR